MIEVMLGRGIIGIHQVRPAWIKRIVEQTLILEGKRNRSVGVLATDNQEIRTINKRYLNHDYATDVLSFGLDESDHLGDLAVSVQMARSVAAKLGISCKEELARYLVHGTLHLLGYDDKNFKDKKRMFKRQEDILLCINQGH